MLICIAHHLGDSWEWVREARSLAFLVLQNRIPSCCQMAPVYNSGTCFWMSERLIKIVVQTETSALPARITLSDFLALSPPDRTVNCSCEISTALKTLHLLKIESLEAPDNLALASYPVN